MPFQTGNPFIDALMGGGNPSVMDFLNPLNQGGLPQGIMPGEQAGIPAGQSPGLGAGLDSFLQRPGGLMLLNLLAQEGSGPMPGSPLGAIGRAGVATSQQLNRNRLVEAQTGALEQASGQGQRRVQSAQPLENGNIGFLDAFTGEVIDTGVRAGTRTQVVDIQGKGRFIFDPIEQTLIPIADEATITEGISGRAGAQTSGTAQATAAASLPADLAGLDSTINTADATIAKINEVLPLVKDENVGIESRVRGDLPGVLGGEARTLKQQVKSLQANFGFDTLQKMRAASKTGGALGQVSERELDLLINALRSIDLEGDVDVLKDNLGAVVTHYENYKREIEKMKNALREQAGQGSAEVRIDFRTLPRRDE